MAEDTGSPTLKVYVASGESYVGGRARRARGEGGKNNRQKNGEGSKIVHIPSQRLANRESEKNKSLLGSNHRSREKRGRAWDGKTRRRRKEQVLKQRETKEF